MCSVSSYHTMLGSFIREEFAAAQSAGVLLAPSHVTSDERNDSTIALQDPGLPMTHRQVSSDEEPGIPITHYTGLFLSHPYVVLDHLLAKIAIHHKGKVGEKGRYENF